MPKKPPPKKKAKPASTKKTAAMPSHGDAVKMAEAALGDTEF